MKKLALIAAAFAVMGMTKSALAGPYVKGGVGYVGTNDTVEALIEDGQDYYNGAVGYDFGDVSAEVEYLYLPGSAVDLHGIMLNAYYEIPKSDVFVTAGIGGVHPDAEGIDFSLHHITGAYQLGAGVSVQVYGPVSVEPTIGYFSTWQGLHEGDIPLDFSGFYGNVSFKVAL